MSNTCNKTINNYNYKSKGWEGRGFGRRFIAVYKCECGAERKMRINSYIGKSPHIAPGAFVCGGFIKKD